MDALKHARVNYVNISLNCVTENRDRSCTFNK